MGRFRSLVRPVRKKVSPKKQDTPLKSSLFRGNKLKKPLASQVYEALPEEEEVRHFNIPPTRATEHTMAIQERNSIKPSRTEADKDAGSSESGTTPSLVIDTSFSSGDESSSSPSQTSSSLPSPEVFREECYVESFTFRIDDDLVDLPFSIKNSTLLDLSHAETILMHQPPNLSTIMDAPTILAENSSPSIVTSKRPSDGCKIVKEPTPDQACKTKPPFANKKPILFKKKVWFRSPLFSNRRRRESVATPKPSEDKIIKEELPPSPHKPIKADIETVKKEKSEVEDGGIFFDFVSDAEQERFFQKMRERYDNLNKIALFPSNAVVPKKSAVS